MGKHIVIFFNIVFDTLLRTCDISTLFSIFDRITSSREDHQSVKSGLKSRFKSFMLSNRRTVRMHEEQVQIIMKGLNRGVTGL